MLNIWDYLAKLLANPLPAVALEPDPCEFGTFGENMYATKPAKNRNIIIDIQGDFFSARPLLLGADALPLCDEGFTDFRTLGFIVAVVIFSPQYALKIISADTYIDSRKHAKH